MKHSNLVIATILMVSLFACKKSASDSKISLVASATKLIVGDTLTVTLAADANASNWTITPSATASKAYTLTTSKVNYFSFSQPGVYTISVRARNINYDSTYQQLASAWTAGGGNRGNCTRDIDTASVAITVTGK